MGFMMLRNNQKSSGRAAALAAYMLATTMFYAAPVSAGVGDLLVAPTRIVFEGSRGTEVILNNIGSEEATYRISLELRRMNKEGELEEISEADATANEKLALSLIRYAPKRVTLTPDQPQSIRVGLQPEPMAALIDGEYRVHMLFRAIPKAEAPRSPDEKAEGVQIKITPIYGVTIPLIIRKGKLNAQAAIANPRLIQDNGRSVLAFDMTRQGEKSVYGNVIISKPGVSEPLWTSKGIAIYPETDARKVNLPVSEAAAAQLHGPITVAYHQTAEAGGGLIAETKAVLP
jgi:P pilus assembly chaperone PapD